MSKRGHYKWDAKTKKMIKCEPEKPREVNAPFVLTDDMPATKHMGNQKFYTSKRRFRDATKAGGWEEVGNEVNHRAAAPIDPRAEEKLEAEITKAYYAVRDGQAELSELDKERCKIINKNLKEYNHDRRAVGPDGKPIE